MKVWALITDCYGGYGGIALYNKEFFRALNNHAGVQQIIAFPRVRPEFEEPIVENKLDYRLDAAGSKLHYLLTLLKVFRQGNRPDLLICGHINLWPIAKLIAMLHKVSVILVLHGVEAWTKPQGFSGHINFQEVNKVLCVSNVTRERFLQWADVPAAIVTTIPNCIHLSAFGLGPKPFYLLERYGLKDSKVILTVGRLDAREQAKGFDQILEALPKLLFAQPEIKYLIVGDGSDLPRLQQKARNMNIAAAVRFTGRIAESEKADHYRLADVYAMPSRWEGFGFVFLEAMACGIPVIASSIDGGREALRDGTLGKLVDPIDTQALIAAILASLELPKAILPGLEYFSYENFEQRLHAALQPLIPSVS